MLMIIDDYNDDYNQIWWISRFDDFSLSDGDLNFYQFAGYGDLLAHLEHPKVGVLSRLARHQQGMAAKIFMLDGFIMVNDG